jgi:hypothetical protein
MKSSASVLMGLVAAATLVTAQEQVTIDFRNYIPGVLDAPVFDLDGTTRLEGVGFTAQLFCGPAGTVEGSLAAAAGSVCSFQIGTNAGYWLPQQVPLPPMLKLGDRVSLQVRVWESIPIPWPPERNNAGVQVRSQVLSLVVTNSLMPLVGLESMRLEPERLWAERQQDQFMVRWVHQGASRYELQTTDTLTTSNSWNTLFTWSGLAGFGTTLSVTNPVAGPQRFYRLERWR